MNQFASLWYFVLYVCAHGVRVRGRGEWRERAEGGRAGAIFTINYEARPRPFNQPAVRTDCAASARRMGDQPFISRPIFSPLPHYTTSAPLSPLVAGFLSKEEKKKGGARALSSHSFTPS